MGRKSYQALTLILCLVASCVKDKPAATPKPVLSGSGNVYVVCEGNFGYGDAALFVYEKAKDSVYGDLYKSINGQGLGDVFQSMTKIGDRFFLCVNNSDKVVAINSGDLSFAGGVNIFKPRYVLALSATKAYVTSEYQSKVYVINPQTIQVTDTFSINGKNTEGMCLYGNSAFICAWDTTCNEICKVDIGTNKIIQKIKVAGYAPQEALLDREQMLWVLSGNPNPAPAPPGKGCVLTRIDPSTGDILASYAFPDYAAAIKPVFNPTRDTLYFIEFESNFSGGTANNGIYRIGINDAALPAVPFIAAKGIQYFYGLGIDPATGLIYVGDPKGFGKKGSVYVYRQDGTQVRSFDVGDGPGHFYFDE
jgi:DNA-binding beta-propeller fold protein YncE